MPSLMEFLPLLRGWRFSHDIKYNQTLSPGKTFRIPLEERWDKPGWIRCVIGCVNNPHTIIEHNVYEKPVSLTPFLLYRLGTVRPPPTGGAWLDRYDAINNIYTVCFAPMPPQEFKAGTQIIIKHPGNDPLTSAPIGNINIIVAWWNAVLIYDEDEFRKSLKQVFGTEALRG